MSRIRKLGLGLLGVFSLLLLLDVAVLPGVLRTQVQHQVAERFHRRLTVGNITLNPLTLSLTIHGAELLEPDGKTPFLSFDTVEARFSLSSLWHAALVLRELRLVRPRVRIVLLAPHHYNFDDLLRPSAEPAAPSAQLPRFALHNLQIEAGEVVLEDFPHGTTHDISNLQLGLPFLSTLSAEEKVFVEPALSARVDGSELVLKGRLLPFVAQPQADLRLDLEQVDLPRYLDYLPHSLPVRLTGGRANLHLGVNFRADAQKGSVVQVGGNLEFSGLQMASAGSVPAWKAGLSMARIELRGVTLHLADQAAALDQGNLTLADLKVEDHSVKPALNTSISNLSLTLEGLSTSGAAPGRISLQAALDREGQIQVKGTVGLSAQEAALELDLRHLNLVPFWPYLTSRLNLALTRGQGNAQGRLQLARAAHGEWLGGFQGRLSLDNVSAVDPIHALEVLRWKSLDLREMQVRFTPLTLEVGQVALADFFARIDIQPDGRINLQQMVRPPSVPPFASASRPEAVPVIAIRTVILQGGAVHFSDHYVQPHYSADLRRLGGVVSGLFSRQSTHADVDLRGEVNQAPLHIVGQINPLSGNLFMDLQARVTGMEMAPLSPYSDKYMGYDIEEGKLTFQASYHVENGALTAQNHLVLDRLTFGNRVESSDATHLPVLLAIALLKDRNGVINVEVPVDGSLNDPQFSVGGIILKMLFNLITKAVTSPFEMLGAFFEHGAATSSVTFASGSMAISPESEGTLRSLARALTERPALRLEIAGHANRQADQDGLQRADIDHRVWQALIRDRLSRGQSAGNDHSAIPAGEYPALLEQAYESESFPKPRTLLGLPKTLPVPEMEKLMMANSPVTDEMLANLALHRAEGVREWLVREGRVPPERVYVVREGPAPAGAATTPGQVDFSLK